MVAVKMRDKQNVHYWAAFAAKLANYCFIWPLLAETDFPDELVMNYWPEQALAYLGIENSKC